MFINSVKQGINMRLCFRQDAPQKSAGKLSAKGPPPPWMIPDLEKQERRRRPLEEPKRQPELPLEGPQMPLRTPPVPDNQEERDPQRGIVIIDS